MNEQACLEARIRGEHRLYQINDDVAYELEPLVNENSFLTMPKQKTPLPGYESAKGALPSLIWDGHPQAEACFKRAWELAFEHLRQPEPQDGMVSNYIDTAFNGFLFMWDSSFITMFGRYGANAFDFQKTLDNFYARQHIDGFICREICERDKGDQFHRFDPVSTGPNILPWAEWESYLLTGDVERVRRVFPPLLAYHNWLKRYRTWRDGAYWSTGWGSGMDNQPRQPQGCNPMLHHGYMVWADTCMQQILSCKVLIRMAKLIGREADVAALYEERDRLTRVVNDKLWDERTAFYYDLWQDGQRSGVKSIGAYWALIAGVVPPERMDSFVAHLLSEKEFNRPHRIPTLSAEHSAYDPRGGYWLGGVWSPTNYMVLKGLHACGYDELAREIALNHVDNVCEVFGKTGTLWENYAPESACAGMPAKPDFVGWTGLSAIAIPIEHVFGITSDGQGSRIIWNVRCTERHGVLRYPIKGGAISLICPARAQGEKPDIIAESSVPCEVELRWQDGQTKVVNASIVA